MNRFFSGRPCFYLSLSCRSENWLKAVSRITKPHLFFFDLCHVHEGETAPHTGHKKSLIMLSFGIMFNYLKGWKGFEFNLTNVQRVWEDIRYFCVVDIMYKKRYRWWDTQLLLHYDYFLSSFIWCYIYRMFWPWMKRLKWFCPVLPPALFQEQQASCLNVTMFVCLMHGYIFLLYVYLLNKDGCWEMRHVCFTSLISTSNP